MASVFQPPPTWALPILVDERTNKAIFSPVWLKWFVDLSKGFSSGGAIPGSGTVTQVDTGAGLTGGPITTTGAVALLAVGTAGTYTKITFNAYGQETSGTSAVLASVDYANQGTTVTVLFGNASGNPSWRQPVLASADFLNQGATTTVLHGNAAGNPSWSAIVAADAPALVPYTGATGAVTLGTYRIDAGVILGTGSPAALTSGTGVESAYTGGIGYLTSVARAAGPTFTYQPLQINAASISLGIGTTGAVTAAMTIPASGYIASTRVIDVGTVAISSTSAGHAYVTGDATLGALLQGSGSFADVALVNISGGAAAYVPTGTQNLNIVGLFTPGTGILGVATNSSATAGNVGEYVESVVGATNYAATTQWGDLTSMSLTAGDWDVSLVVNSDPSGATMTVIQAGISTTSGNSSTGLVLGSSYVQDLAPTAVAQTSEVIPSYRMSLAGTTTIYAKIAAVYSAGTPRVYGRLSARRVR